MQRAWATGAEHDQGPMEWVAAIGDDAKLEAHIRQALDVAITPDATIAQCQAGLLAVECVTYLQGGDADLDPHVHVWMRDLHPNSDEALRATALDVLARLRADSALATHWKSEPSERQAAWAASLDNLRERLTTAKRKPDPRTDPRIVAFARNFEAAKDHLRVALVAYEVTDEPVVHVKVAPGFSIIVHYAEVDELEPLAVPIEHARAWKRAPADLAKLAAKRTREVTDIRTHILENEGFEVGLSFGNTSFTAGLLPYANLLIKDGGVPHGMLVAAPNAGTVVFHRILDAKWNEAAVVLIEHIREMYEVSAARISPQLWWLHKGKLVDLPYVSVANHVVIEPVEEFVSYVAKLG
jgi:hypothetical protein